MAWTTPVDVNPGDAILASLWNQDVVDNLTELAPFFSAWTTITPTTSGFTLGNGTIAARRFRIGSMIAYVGTLTFGSTTSVSGTLRIGLGTGGGSNIRDAIGQAIFIDGSTYYHGISIIETSIDSGLLGFYRSGGSASMAAVGATVPFTWANGDKLLWSILYEIAP